MELTSSSWDMVVVGAGLAGLTAALRATELGARVALLEQGSTELYPCNSRFSGGIIHVAHRNVRRSPAELLQFIYQATGDEVDKSVAEAMAAHSGRFLNWLQSQGGRFIRFGNNEALSWCLAPPRPISAGLDWKGRGADTLLRLLCERFRNKGGQIFLGVRATALTLQEAKCTGVRTLSEKGEHVWHAESVVIADGGFQADPDFFREFIGPRPDLVVQRGAGNSRGDGLRMALEAGAGSTSLSAFYGGILNRDALTNPKLWPYPELDSIVTAALIVNTNGERFLDEGQGGVAIANHLARRENPADAMLVLDDQIWNGPGRSARIPVNPCMLTAGGTIYQADSLEKLAKLINVPEPRLVNTVDQFNHAVANRKVENLSPPRTYGKQLPHQIIKPPFMAIPICAGITYTMGGISIDGNARVLDVSGTPIAGLFAAGSATGGLEGGRKFVYVSGLAKAGVLGLLAAETAIATKPSPYLLTKRYLEK